MLPDGFRIEFAIQDIIKLNMQNHGTPKLIPPTCFGSTISRIFEEIRVVKVQDSGWIIQAIFLDGPDISRTVFFFPGNVNYKGSETVKIHRI
jgi:hypothetical protein